MYCVNQKRVYLYTINNAIQNSNDMNAATFESKHQQLEMQLFIAEMELLESIKKASNLSTQLATALSNGQLDLGRELSEKCFNACCDMEERSSAVKFYTDQIYKLENL